MDFKKIVEDLGLEAEHQIDLRWFLSHRGVVQGFPERLDSSDYLANSYQGIYRPHGYKYALSIRVSLDSPYRHGHFFSLRNDGWVFAYHPEMSEKDLQNLDQSWTILRISECQDNRVPLGILRQTGMSDKGKSQYEIMGLGIVVGKFGEYFVIASRVAK